MRKNWRSRLGESAHTAGGRDAGSRLDGVPDPYHDPFRVHAHQFTVFVPAWVGRSARDRRALERLLHDESPAHTRWHVEYVAPRFRVGVQSAIGLDTVVGAYPAGGVRLGETTLDRATVLGPAPGPPHPALRVGAHAPLGVTTRLD